MEAQTFYKVVTVDHAGVLDRLVEILRDQHVEYCVIGGQGVNAYVDPVVSLDLDIVIAASDVSRLVKAFPAEWQIDHFAHSVNISAPGSDLRVQVQTDPRYQTFLARVSSRIVLGTRLMVASLDDVLTGKVWAVQDEQLRPSKRQKDLADIARILERYPDLRSHVPQGVLDRLV